MILERTDATKGNTSFAKVLDDYAETLGGADSTKTKKRAVIAKLKQTWFGIDTCRCARSSHPSESVDGKALRREEREPLQLGADGDSRCFRDGRQRQDHRRESGQRFEVPRSATKPIRTTPTFEQFNRIVADIRAQRFNADAEQSGDFVEFLGLGWTRTS